MPYSDKDRKREYEQQYRKDNADKFKKYNADYHAKRTGISADELEALTQVYDGQCWLCGKVPAPKKYKGTERRALNLDHDHSCCPGRFPCGKCARGMLCHSCNAALGWIEGNEGIVQKALDYLANPPIQDILAEMRAQ